VPDLTDPDLTDPTAPRLFDSGFTVLDLVLDQVLDSVGRRPAESGGALVGCYARSLVTGFVFDADASVTGVTYEPSPQLTTQVQALELTTGVAFKGVLHSHPGIMDTPSGPDRSSFAAGLLANPELGRYLAPIVTLAGAPPAPHRIALAGGVVVSFHVAFVDAVGALQVRQCRPRVLWFARDCRRLAAALHRPAPHLVGTAHADPFVASAEILLTSDLTLTLAAPADYPTVAPLALVHDRRTETTRQVHLRWRLDVDPDHRLGASFGPTDLPDTGADRAYVAFGRSGVVLTPRRDLAHDLDLEPLLVDETFYERLDAVRDGLFARSRGILHRRLGRAHVLVAGCGSVGSYAAEQFVRAGVGRLTLLDPDVVAEANLSRANFTMADVGRPKVAALAERLLAINPALDVRIVPTTLASCTDEWLRLLLPSTDLVVSALDDRSAQLALNQWSYWHDVPAVYLGLFAGAKSGEACVVRPPHACFRCATTFRTLIAPDDQGERDYGTGRLSAEVALGTDIHAVTAVGVRLGLSCLVRDGEVSLSAYADTALAEHAYALVAVSDDVPIVAEVIGAAPAQFSHRSIWLSVRSDPTCNVCGEHRDPPGTVATPSADDLRRLFAAEGEGPAIATTGEVAATAAAGEALR